MYLSIYVFCVLSHFNVIVLVEVSQWETSWLSSGRACVQWSWLSAHDIICIQDYDLARAFKTYPIGMGVQRSCKLALALNTYLSQDLYVCMYLCVLSHFNVIVLVEVSQWEMSRGRACVQWSWLSAHDIICIQDSDLAWAFNTYPIGMGVQRSCNLAWAFNT